ncbi:BspA family leucine-rich repeat surface protein [Candidatus Aquiluna sp. UB-MaderosW2red]|uniref:BspA family leucine-rich repeat surface protein n=1 Tax=Candidatus Aquiluna sp. UB-MaderosW2red TaxID=1855377 RepID=UPI000875CD47|nr:BspA family leucine-rich repeat surface protein [Candidatus Aquiluna sp. UB-MaderosW2red]SCX05975.1 protein of unknown function, DUF285 [Candidatus Aquiluna sp. UB-MaderosW2red]
MTSFRLRRPVFRPTVAVMAMMSLIVSAFLLVPSVPEAQAQTSAGLKNDYDYYADLDGTTQYFRGIDNQAVIPATAFTLEAWVRPADIRTGQDYYSVITQNQKIGGGEDNRVNFGLRVINGTYGIHYGSSSTANTDLDALPGSGIPTNQWSHIAVTSEVGVTGGKTTIWLNGKQVGQSDNAFSVLANATGTAFSIGATGGPTAKNWFKGGIDQVKVWNGVLSQNDIQKSMHAWDATGITPSTLRAHYDFNDKSASGGFVFDAKATTNFNYRLAIKGAPTFPDVKTYQEHNGKQVFTFPRSYLTENGGWRAPNSATKFSAAILAGGGGGGPDNGSGGGGGALYLANNKALPSSRVLGIVVGQGGVGVPDEFNASSGQVSAISSSSIIQSNGGFPGWDYTDTNANTSLGGPANGSPPAGDESFAGARGGASPTCSDAPNPGLPGQVLTMLGVIVGSGGGGGTSVGHPTSAGGPGAGSSSNSFTTGSAGEANRGGGGGAGSGCNNPAKTPGGNGGSGLVIVTVDFVGKCLYVNSGFTLTQVPKVQFFGIQTDPKVQIRSESSQIAVQAAFYGESAIVGDQMYFADRGRQKLRRYPLDASRNVLTESIIGDLPTPGMGVTADERYVYAWNNTGIARYDTLTQNYQKTFIDKGDIAKVDGEMAFGRFEGVGYLFIASDRTGFTDAAGYYSDVYAVPVSGMNAQGVAAIVPAALSKTAHLFSKSKLSGASPEANGSSGIAVIGKSVYWTTGLSSSINSKIWTKVMTPANLPGYPRGGESKTSEAGQMLKEYATQNFRGLSADSEKLYFQATTYNVDSLNPKTLASRTEVLDSAMSTTANGILPAASCPIPIIAGSGRSSFYGGNVATQFPSIFPQNTLGVSYRVEYRINGGPWVLQEVTSGRTASLIPPSDGLYETRVATLVGGELSEFGTTFQTQVGALPDPPLCDNPTKLVYQVTAGTTVRLDLTTASSPGVVKPVVVDWGNGTKSPVASWATGDFTFSKSYPTAGTYTIDICGEFAGFGNASISQDRLSRVIQWGAATATLTDLSFAFNNATILNDVPAVLPAGVTTLESAFLGAAVFNDADVKLWNTDNVVNFAGMFSGAKAFNQDIGTNSTYWNTAKATNMSNMFNGATAFNNGNADTIKNWDTALVTNTSSMFEKAANFNQSIPTDGNKWKTSSVTQTQNMFNGAAVFNQNIGTWDTANVENFSGMFKGATVFNNGGSAAIQDWNTAKVLKMDSMFAQARAFNQPLPTAGSKWDVSKVSTMEDMFSGASSFNQVLTSWVTSKVSNMNRMFFSATAFNSATAFEIPVLTTAANMFSYSGLSDDNYGTVIIGFDAEQEASRALTGVVFGAVDKTAFCDTAHASLLDLAATVAASGAAWTITDKTNRTLSCAPTVTITAANATHVYGEPVPSIGFTKVVTGESLPTSDWLSEVQCKAVVTSDGANVLATSAAVSGAYKTSCTGPSGTGIGIKVVYVDGTYSVSQRPITVRAKDQAIFSGQPTTDTPATALSTDSALVMVTSGSILAGDVVHFTLGYTPKTGTAAVASSAYTGSGAMNIIPAAATTGSIGATGNYLVTGSNAVLTVSELTYIIAAKSQVKTYGNLYSFSDADWICTMKVTTGSVISEGACSPTPSVSISSAGASANQNVSSTAITLSATISGVASSNITTVAGTLEVVPRVLTVIAETMVVPYGSGVPTYPTPQITGFANGQDSSDVTAPTCGSGYNPDTARGTVLNITCGGGNPGSNYRFVYPASSPTLTVPALSTVSSDVPITTSLPEDVISADSVFRFGIAPVNRICFANLIILDGINEPNPIRQEVTSSSVVFELPLDIGEYEYELFLDGNCDAPTTRGMLSILEYVAPVIVPEATVTPAPSVAPAPYTGPQITDFSARQLPGDKPATVVLDGVRLSLVTDVWVGETKITFTRNDKGQLILSLPALAEGKYDLRLGFEGGGMITNINAFIILKAGDIGNQTPPTDTLPKTIGTRTLRYTNFGGDSFSLPRAARTGITKTLIRLEDVNRVVCRGFTSASRPSAQDKKLANLRANAACDLAKRFASDAIIETRSLPAAGIGPRFRAVNIFIAYNID